MNDRSKWLFTFVLLPFMGLVSACGNDRIFEDYQGMESLTWGISDTVSFELIPTDTGKVISTIGIKYNDSYEFHNLYVRFLLKDSLDQPLQDSLINIDLYDSKTGKPLGDGFGNIFTVYDTLPLKVINEKVPVKVQFIQYMRRENLKGIESVGLKIINE